jgi:hypothetical protein
MSESTKELSGRELRDAVALRVMGWTLADRRAMGWSPGPDVWLTGDEENPTEQDWWPNESIEAAMRVVEKMRERHWCVSIMNQFHKGPQWFVSFEGAVKKDIRQVSAHGDSLPAAICACALAAMEQKS